MERQLNITYETVGASSYMKMVFPSEAELDHYELEMILANEVKNFLGMSRQMADGELVLYYNITSRVPLSELLRKRKLTRSEFLCLIKGAVLAARDAAEFRLSEEKIIMDPELIYVNPATCDPAFLFLPAKEIPAMGLKELIMELVLKGQLEISEDNLIQVLLQEVNQQPFSAVRLEKSLEPYFGHDGGRQGISGINPASAVGSMGNPAGNLSGNYAGGQPGLEPQHGFENQPGNGGRQGTPVWPGGISDVRQAGQSLAASAKSGEESVKSYETSEKESKPPKNGRPLPGNQLSGGGKKPDPQKGKEKTKTKTKTKTEQQEHADDGEFDAGKAKKMFLLPQALVAVVIAACISFGLFVNAEGNPAVDVILAVGICVAVAEVVLYREIYVNGKAKAGGKKETKKEEKVKKKNTDTSKKEHPRPGKGKQNSSGDAGTAKERQLVTPKAPSGMENAAALSEKQTAAQTVAGYQQIANPAVAGYRQPANPSASGYQQPTSQTAARSFQQGFGEGLQAGRAEEADLAGETEMWSGAEEMALAAYLEYFENGRLNRIPIQPGTGLVVGRLQSQVDFAVKSPKVGKIHARFYEQNGQYFVVDINSKNGTYINGSAARIDSNIPYPLNDKDRISLADSEFTIRCTAM